jgi:hypothetical protein
MTTKRKSVAHATVDCRLCVAALFKQRSVIGSAYEIDPAELFRLFPPKLSATVEGQRSETHREHLLLDDAHRRKVLLLREQLGEVRTDRRVARTSPAAGTGCAEDRVSIGSDIVGHDCRGVVSGRGVAKVQDPRTAPKGCFGR